MSLALRQNYRPVVAAALAASGVALLGGLNTVLGPWYYSLHKPAWQPPDWLFGPAWTLIFACTALAGVYFWRRERHRAPRIRVLSVFAVNGLLNIGWTLLFFRLEHPAWALYEVGFLWLSILLLMGSVRRASPLSAVLLLPYLCWVSFAAILNWKIVALNAV